MGYKLLFFTLFLWANTYIYSGNMLYTSFMSDPAHELTIQWLDERKGQASVSYQQNEKWTLQEGTAHQSQGLWIHTVQLKELKPDCDVYFKVAGLGKTYCVKTLPETLSRPVRFVIGGDLLYKNTQRFKNMNMEISSQNPDFAIVGGDIAYSLNIGWITRKSMSEKERWKQFFSVWNETMVRSDGRLIPIIPVIGNHDVKSKKSQLFFDLFAFTTKNRAYRTLDCGNYLNLMLLDSGHVDAIENEQTDWLEKTLKEHRLFPFKIPVYHISAYPGHYSYDSHKPRLIRKNWVPLFEGLGVQAAFEHHNHCYKQTHPIKEGKIDPEGVVYCGDGSWGVPVRQPKSYWYLESAAAANAYYLLTLEDEMLKIEPRTYEGKLLNKPLIINKNR
jgi:hypothetical protein